MSVDTAIRLADGDHVVQFYGDDRDLVAAVAGYLGAAIRAGEAGVLIAERARCDAATAALAAAGVDVAAAIAAERLIVLDAGETLGRFLVDGMPDPAAFEAVVGGVVRRAAAADRPVRAYGEMVAVLWDEGNVAAAVELERLWNDLGQRLAFSLFCAYSSQSVAGPEAADAFAEVCHLHSAVVAGAPSPDGSEVARRFAASPHGPRLARRFVAQTLRGWGHGDLVDDASLVVAELGANAVSHASSDFTVGLSRTGDSVHLVVGDASGVVPAPRDPDPAIPGGRGLRLVAGIARRWGHDVVDGGKLVWAELATAR